MKSPVEKLTLLRNYLHQKNIDIYIIPSSDPHLGENLADRWRIIEWLTGFSGSAATVVVTNSFAGLWTDSRYYLQAARELSGSGFELIQPETYKSADFADFIYEISTPGSIIAFDGKIVSISKFRNLEKRLRDKRPSFQTDIDPVPVLWENRPELPSASAFSHSEVYCGKDRQAKIAEVRKQMEKQNAAFHFLAAVDDIMWLLNIRGNDVKYNPLLLSYVLVGIEQVLLFTDENKIPANLAKEFDSDGIVILPYEEVVEILPYVTEGEKVLIDPGTISVALFNAISGKAGRIIEDLNIPARLKALKNKTEIANIENAMIKDGVALTGFFFWFESNSGKVAMTESSLSEKLLEFRSQQRDFLSPSFETIAAFNENSALPHYSPVDGHDLEITDRGILLVDSGGQYLDGTTDITRTIAVGVPTSWQRKDFTLVLKGHINLAMAKFPSGTRGYQLDSLARSALWKSGLNYGHGTGHGVGFCLNVHEGPQSISPADNKTAFEPGMLTSNEPGIYREGEYGIRTENLMVCYEDEVTEFGRFLKFDTISLCYIDKSLIDKELLDQKEKEWLDAYHSDLFDNLSPFLSHEERIWLRDKTSPL